MLKSSWNEKHVRNVDMENLTLEQIKQVYIALMNYTGFVLVLMNEIWTDKINIHQKSVIFSCGHMMTGDM